MKFIKGDTVYCINPVVSNNPTIKNLQKNIPYTVDKVFSNDKFEESIIVVGNGIKLRGDRFITLQELRSRKIKKIKDGIQQRRHSSLY